MKRIPTLDGWRAIAILLVIADHAQLGLFSGHPFGITGGHGVAIFFVLSGYLITSKLQAERNDTGSLNLKSFYLRRFFRLMPVAWLYLGLSAFVLILMHRLYHPIELLGALFFFRNYINYPDLSPLTGHFWSLSVEEQFYLVWPPLFSLLGKRHARWIAIVAAMAIAIYRFSQRKALLALPIQATLGTQFRADALLIGCIAALVLPAYSRHFRSWMIWPLIAALGICLWQFGFLIPAGESIVIALLIHATSIFSGSALGKILELKPIAYLGTISYSIYIWQQPLLCTTINSPKDVPLRILLTFVIAALSYHGLEQPLIQFGKRFTPKQATSEPVVLPPLATETIGPIRS